RDLVDVAAVSAGLPQHDLDRAAASWGLARVWRMTQATTEALLAGESPRLPTRVWTRQLEFVRERTLLEELFAKWLQSFSKLPPHLALVEAGEALVRGLLTRPGEAW